MTSSTCIILDSGSSTTRAGLSGSSTPSLVPTVVGVPLRPGLMESESRTNATIDVKEAYTGEDLFKLRGLLVRKNPVQFGVVVNWSELEEIWRYTFFSVLKISPSEHSVVVTENVLNAVASRERLVQILLDSIGAKEVAVEKREVLGLKQSGRETGAVVSVGAEVTLCVPVYQGFVVTKAVMRIDKGGRIIGEYLQKLMESKGVFFSAATYEEKEILQRMKEQLCYISLDYENEANRLKEAKKTVEKSFELPDGNVISLGTERYQAPEILFTPGITRSKSGGLVDMVYNAISCSDRIQDSSVDVKQLRYELFANIVLAGGSTLFPGFAQRLKLDLTAMAPSNTEVNVIALPQRRHLAWMGGSTLAAQRKLEFLSRVSS